MTAQPGFRWTAHALSRATACALVAATLVGCGGSDRPRPTPTHLSAAEPQTAPAQPATLAGDVVAVGDTPEGLVVDPGSGFVVAALRRPDGLALVTPTSPHTVRFLMTAGRARHLRLAAPGLLLLAGEDIDQLLEVTLPAGAVIKRYPTGRQPHDAVLAGGRIWVTDELAGTVTALGAGGRTLPAGLQPGGLGAAAGRVAVADVRGNRLYVFDAAGVRQVADLPAGAGPTHVVAVGADTVAVADTRGNAILLYSLRGTPRLLGRFPISGGPYGLAADPARKRLWVALSGRNQLVRFDVEADRLVERGGRLATVRQPNSVAVDPATGDLVVAGATPHGVLQFLPAG